MPTRRRTTALQQAFGDRIRGIRQELGLTQEALAHQSGVNRTYIGHMEAGRLNPTLRSIVRIALALGVDPSELIAGLQAAPDRPDRAVLP